MWPVGVSGPLTKERYQSLVLRIRGNPRVMQKGSRVGSMNIQFIVRPLSFLSPLSGGSLVDQGFDGSTLIRNCIHPNKLEQPCTSWWSPHECFEVDGQNRQHWQKTQSLTSGTWTTGGQCYIRNVHVEVDQSGRQWWNEWNKPRDPAASCKWLTPPHNIICEFYLKHLNSIGLNRSHIVFVAT